MTQATRESRAKRTLRVSVHARPGYPQPVRPRGITLTDHVYKVVWECADLPPGGELLIVFQEDPRGPFFRMEFSGSRVTGYGNRGPAHTSRHYVYEARLRINGTVEAAAALELPQAETPQPGLCEGEMIVLGAGMVENNAGQPCDPPPGPPWETSVG